MIAPSVLALHVFGLSDVWLFDGVSGAKTAMATAWLVYGVVAYCFGLVAFDRLLSRRSVADDPRCDGAVYFLVPLSICVLLGIVYALSGVLPIFYLGQEGVGVLRKSVTTDANFSPFFRSAISYLSHFGMAYAGSAVAYGKKRLAWLLLVPCAVGLLWTGEKAPVLVGMLTTYFAYLWFAKRKIGLMRMGILVVLGLSGAWLLFKATLPGIDDETVMSLLAARLFLGQVSGFYQAYAFASPDSSYVLGWVPFSGLMFGRLPEYAKEFMGTLYAETDTSGYLNSIFLQEAWAVLGSPGLIISPFVTAASIVVSLFLIERVLGGIVRRRFVISCCFSYMNVNTITSSFGQFVFLKALIFPLVLFGALGGLCYVLQLTWRRGSIARAKGRFSA